jgi:hypothetical protein
MLPGFLRRPLLGNLVNRGNSAYPLTTSRYPVIVTVAAISTRLLQKEVASISRIQDASRK